MGVYLVTGAAGFIGASVAQRLINEDHQVTTIDNISTGFRDGIPAGVEFIEGDCQDAAVLQSLENRHFDAIFHIAGQSSAEVSFDNPVYDLQTNTQSTLLLLKLALTTECAKLVYASSMSVYGDQPDRPTSENTLPVPKSFYGVGKLASEHYLRIYQEYGIDGKALRLFNVYGPGQNMENLRQGMVSIYLAQALQNNHIVVKGSPGRYRDFVYIDDVVEAFMCAADMPSESGGVYNVATGVRTTVQALIETIQYRLPAPVTVEYMGSTPGDQFGLYGDASKIGRELGWKPRTDLSSGLRTMIDWAIAEHENLNK